MLLGVAGGYYSGMEPELTESQKAELDRRIAEDDATPDEGVTWDEVKAAALKRAGRGSS